MVGRFDACRSCCGDPFFTGPITGRANMVGIGISALGGNYTHLFSYLLNDEVSGGANSVVPLSVHNWGNHGVHGNHYDSVTLQITAASLPTASFDSIEHTAYVTAISRGGLGGTPTPGEAIASVSVLHAGGPIPSSNSADITAAFNAYLATRNSGDFPITLYTWVKPTVDVLGEPPRFHQAVPTLSGTFS
ncbi:MAG: hypothetical protein ACPGLY_28150 [Rubripirellula sp.]